MNGDRGRRLARRVVAALSGLALLAVPAFSLALRDLWPALGPPLADQRLAAIRGGFTTPGGVQFSFGIERTVTINGEMVAITRLVLDNLQNLMLGTMPTAQFATTLGTVIQNGPGNSAPAAATVTGSTLTGCRGKHGHHWPRRRAGECRPCAGTIGLDDPGSRRQPGSSSRSGRSDPGGASACDRWGAGANRSAGHPGRASARDRRRAGANRSAGHPGRASDPRPQPRSRSSSR